MDPVSLITGILVAGIAGFIIGQKFSRDNQQQKQLQQALDEKQQELDAFRQKVNQHFEKTADLFNQVSDSYQSLYEHMAKGSGELCATPSFHSLPNGTSAVQPKVNAQATAGSQAESKNIFNPDKLYNAHEYRNKEEEKEKEKEAALATEKAMKNNKVVDLEKAKEEKREPALDYAIKEKGVINHNSLDREGVKTS